MNTWDPRYDALLYRPHPLSAEHPAMPLRERAAQFSAFKALTGFEEEIEEEGRFTETEAELAEERKAVLDERLRRLWREKGRAVFVWFCPDERKAGGRYCRRSGTLRAFDPIGRVLVLESGEKIPLAFLYDVEEEAPAE